MKNKSYARKLSGLSLGMIVLPLAVLAAPQTKTRFTQTEVTTWTHFGKAVTDGKSLLILGATGNGVTTAGSDSRVLGESTPTLSAIWDMHQVGPFWGSYHKVSPGGTWDGYFQGVFRMVDGHLVGETVNVAVGNGGYEGQVLRKTGTSVDGGPVQWTGCIIEGGPGDRPFQSKGSRVDRLQMVPGMLLDPVTLKPTGKLGMLGRGEVVTGVGEDSHAGRIRDEGVGLIDPETGIGSMMGKATAANGEVTYWVSDSSPDPVTQLTTATVHMVGGTGRFTDAVGGFTIQISETLEPTSDPMIILGSFSFRGRGTIRY